MAHMIGIMEAGLGRKELRPSITSDDSLSRILPAHLGESRGMRAPQLQAQPAKLQVSFAMLVLPMGISHGYVKASAI